MHPWIVEAAGFLGAGCTLLLFMPQAFTAWRNRTNPGAFAGLSLGMLWLSMFAAIGWLVYGYGIDAFWTMVPSFVNIPLVGFILFLVYRSKRIALTSS